MKSIDIRNIEIIRLEEKYTLQVHAILNEQFGEDYILLETLNKGINDKKTLILIALKKGTVLGVSISKIGLAQELSKHLFKEKAWFTSTYEKSNLIGLRKHMAVKVGYEGMGIGTLLVTESIKLLEESCNIVLTIVWKEGNGEIMNKLMNKNSFRKTRTISNYWKKDSIEKKYICSLCEVIPCGCSVIIYAKNITRTN